MALGDWHALAEINARSFYPGTPEPDRHKSGARGQVLAVSLEVGQTPKVTPLPTANYEWPLLSLHLESETAAERLVALRTELEKGHPLRQTHVRLDITGEMTASDWTVFERFSDEMRGECASFDIRGMHKI